MDFFLFLLGLFEKYPLQSDTSHHQFQEKIESMQESHREEMRQVGEQVGQ